MVCVPDSLKVNKEAEKVKLEGKKKPGMNEGADDEEEEGNDDEEEEQSGAPEGVEERPDTEEGISQNSWFSISFTTKLHQGS